MEEWGEELPQHRKKAENPQLGSVTHVPGCTRALVVFPHHSHVLRGGIRGRYGSDATEVGPQRASFPRKIVPCPLEGQMMWCPSAQDYEPMLQNAYGEDYMTPSQ